MLFKMNPYSADTSSSALIGTSPEVDLDAATPLHRYVLNRVIDLEVNRALGLSAISAPNATLTKPINDMADRVDTLSRVTIAPREIRNMLNQAVLGYLEYFRA